MQDKKQQLELEIEQGIVSKLGKKYVKVVYCNPAYLTSMSNTSCEMLGWMKIAGRNINNLRYADDNPYGRKQRGTKVLLDGSERGE